MSYRVEYETVSNKCTEEPKNHRLILLTILCAALFLVLTWHFWPEGKTVLERLAAGTYWEETKVSLEAMALQLKQGVSPGEAVTAFCRELMEKGIPYGY